MFKEPTGETTKSAEQLRKEYEERTTKTAEEKGLDSEDVYGHDAAKENLLQEDKQKRELAPGSLYDRNKEVNSDLTLDYSEDEKVGTLKGGIDGKVVEIQFSTKSKSRGGLFLDKILKGTMDGKPLDVEEAENIYYDYYRIAEKRTSRFDYLAEEKKEQEEKDSKSIEDVREKLTNIG